MVIKFIDRKSTWERFVKKHPDQNFLHSWNWAQMHQRLGQSVYPVGLYDQVGLKGAALFIKEEAKRGPYLTCVGGPLLTWQLKKQRQIFNTFAYQLGRATQVWFVRVRPQLLDTPKNRRLFTNQGYIKAPMHVTAETTWQLNLDQSEEELLKQMRKNHRYDIRKAQRKGVKVKPSRQMADLDLFYKLQLDTARRKDWVPFPKDFLRAEFKSFVKDNQAVIFKAFHEQKLVAMAMFIFYGKEVVYHHAVSRFQARQVSAAYAIIWEAVKEAKKRQFKKINFWGLAPEYKANHRYSGMNLFKQGFGGFPVNYLPAQDLPVSPWYWATYGFERLRKARRGL